MTIIEFHIVYIQICNMFIQICNMFIQKKCFATTNLPKVWLIYLIEPQIPLDVIFVRHEATRRLFAMKKLNKKSLITKNQVKQAYNERDIMDFSQSPLVVDPHCTFQSKVGGCMNISHLSWANVI